MEEDCRLPPAINTGFSQVCSFLTRAFLTDYRSNRSCGGHKKAYSVVKFDVEAQQLNAG